MLRYRYANDSPKRQDWEGAPGFRKIGMRDRPIRRRHHPVVAWAKWHDPKGNSSLGFELYTVERSASFLKGIFGAMVEADKEAVGPWKPKPSTALPGDKYLAAQRRRFNAMVGTDSEWGDYLEGHPEAEPWMPRTTKRGKQLARQGPRPSKVASEPKGHLIPQGSRIYVQDDRIYCQEHKDTVPAKWPVVEAGNVLVDVYCGELAWEAEHRREAMARRPQGSAVEVSDG